MSLKFNTNNITQVKFNNGTTDRTVTAIKYNNNWVWASPRKLIIDYPDYAIQSISVERRAVAYEPTESIGIINPIQTTTGSNTYELFCGDTVYITVTPIAPYIVSSGDGEAYIGLNNNSDINRSITVQSGVIEVSGTLSRSGGSRIRELIIVKNYTSEIIGVVNITGNYIYNLSDSLPITVSANSTGSFSALDNIPVDPPTNYTVTITLSNGQTVSGTVVVSI